MILWFRSRRRSEHHSAQSELSAWAFAGSIWTTLTRWRPVFAQEDVWRYPYGRGFSRSETEAFLEAQIAHWDEIGFGYG